VARTSIAETVFRPNVRTSVETLTDGCSSCCGGWGIPGRVRRSIDGDSLDCQRWTGGRRTCRAGARRRRRRRTLLDERRPKRRPKPSGTPEARPLEEVLDHAWTEHRRSRRDADSVGGNSKHDVSFL